MIGHEWRKEAACADLPVELFFPENGADSKAAKAVCATCPVTAECLDYWHSVTVHGGAMPGVWGGTGERERRTVKRERRTINHGTRGRYKAGCSCVPCKDANAEYMRQRRIVA